MSEPHPDDQALRDYLHGGSVLSQLYRQGAREQPPTHLDTAILAAARQAAATPAPRHGVRLRWALPVSLAAVLVLSVSLVTLMTPHTGVVPPADEVPVPATETAPPPVPAAPGRAPMSMSGPTGGAAPEPAPPPTPAATSTQGAAPTAAPRRPAARAPVLDTGDSAHKRAPAVGTILEQRRTEALSRDFKSEESAPSAAAPLSEQEAAPALAPAAWLGHIEALRRAGREAEAQASLAEFRRRYPAFPLPPELQQ